MNVKQLKFQLALILAHLECVDDDIDVTINDGSWEYTNLKDISIQGVDCNGNLVGIQDDLLDVQLTIHL